MIFFIVLAPGLIVPFDSLHYHLAQIYCPFWSGYYHSSFLFPCPVSVFWLTALKRAFFQLTVMMLTVYSVPIQRFVKGESSSMILNQR